ncbi:MAG: Glycosyl transferase family 2 [Candidatus Moranbacteria bacterium GW2011_GWC2_37_73]|nr:MAG: hypothetical protein UR95_C0006G0003 [Parcubacteria group bacterium GW2011_GWC1_36_108]KKQ39311.1 MAG: Glycosyl transferase family 2 [Candidatus Moranbacteria bacterium GW2011_GWC2_37_73]
METSVIVRTKNEEKWIGAVLEVLGKQTYQNFETVIIDSGSTDRTLEIIKNFPVKLVQITQEEFSYPYALNVGCRASSAQKYFVIISAHAIPLNELFLEIGVKSFSDDNVAGAYGPIRTLADGSIWEKIYFNILCPFFELFTPERMIMKKSRMGVLGNTNSIIRRDLWEQYNFNEEYGLGGEDAEWASHCIKSGYVIIKNKKFIVQHSHSLSFMAFMKQWKYWASLTSPQKFQKIPFRNWKW